MTTEIKDRNFDCGIYIERPTDNTKDMGLEIAKILMANIDSQFARLSFKATQLERENLKLLADNAALLEIIRTLRLDIETYKSTLEGLQ